MSASILALAAVNFILLLMGYSSNDAACRDAARAAGTADSMAVAETAAVTACACHHTDGFMVSQPALDKANFHFADDENSILPYVSVSTDCQVLLPLQCSFSGSDKGGRVGTRRKYVFPALSLIQETPVVESLDITELINGSNVCLPDATGYVQGSGSSDTVDSTE